MNKQSPAIYIVDDEPEVCQALRWLFESVHLSVVTYNTAKDYLDNYNSKLRGCLILDVRMPGMSGLELLDQLRLKNHSLPIIVITAHGDIPMAIRAIKSGAVDFFLKPLNDQHLLEAVQKCLNNPPNFNFGQPLKANPLTERERQVMGLILAGKLNKEIAHELKISISTVEVHRAHIMQKMQAKTLAHLIKIYLQNYN
jgi:two-component system, LuxR family, response regulator FixJ